MMLLWILLAVVVIGVSLAYVWFTLLLVWFPEPMGSDEIHTITAGDVWKLRLYRMRPKMEKAKGEPVLLCHGMASNHHIFFTPRGRSLAETLAERGYDCWAIDLRGCRSAEPPYGRSNQMPSFEDYVIRDLPAAMQYICKTTGFRQLHYVGHSMGGMLLYVSQQLANGHLVASAATVASPPGVDGTHSASKSFVVVLAKYCRGPLSWAMRSLAPFIRLHRAGQAIYPARWENVHPDVDPGFFFHAVEVPPPRVAWQMNHWGSTRTWQAGGRDLDEGLAGFDIPLLCLAAGDDPFVAVERVESFFAALPQKDKALRVLSIADGCQAEYGHVDAMIGLHTREEVFEPIADWFKKHPIHNDTEDQTNAKPAKAKTPPRRRVKAAAKEEPVAVPAKRAVKKKTATAKPSVRPAKKKPGTA